ncbi:MULTISPECIES: TetR/AcrR family transcriptional regulator [unclassified Microbacterium]|uniref:TetR/AcrR family transcriptional regulator n=1 Tax=unclassified Microbacterium TaxID=2609290 RepID=UPI00097F0D6E|nr:TetR/AcrR family transcriptional regulator [Microbacterium sp. JB110]RCS61468.1 TetR/AcrR family transcriptional regulator [Microbacterium sp. JB110]SJM65703.1 Transcriptional regulator, TetR family [Frigoribacterium sp. JB110]
MTQRGAYAKGIAKREEILTVALDVIARHGYRGASVREIAEAVGLSQAGLLHYFDSKDELFTAVLMKRDEVDSASPATDALHDLVRIVAHNAEVPGLVQLFAQLSVEAADPAHPAHGYFAERYVMLRQRFAEALRQGQIDGTLRTTFEPDAAAALVIAATDGLQTQFLLDPGIDMAAHISSLLDDLRV